MYVCACLLAVLVFVVLFCCCCVVVVVVFSFYSFKFLECLPRNYTLIHELLTQTLGSVLFYIKQSTVPQTLCI